MPRCFAPSATERNSPLGLLLLAGAVFPVGAAPNFPATGTAISLTHDASYALSPPRSLWMRFMSRDFLRAAVRQ